MQVDAVAYRQSSQDEIDGSTGAPLNETRALLRRGRIRAEVENAWVVAAFEVDANTVKGPTARPIRAEVSLRWPARAPAGDEAHEWSIMATLGLLRTPFGFEVAELDTVRPFLERSGFARAFFPGEFDLGARVQGHWRFLRAALALVNGHPNGELAYPDRDPTHSKDLVGRIGVEVPVAGPVELHAGLSALSGTGFHAGTPATKDTLAFHDNNQNGIVDPSEIQFIPGSPATPSETFGRFAVGLDARVFVRMPRVGRLMLRGELVWAKNLDRGLEPADPVSTGRDLREHGWSIGFDQEVGPHLQLGMRYDRYDPDADARRQVPTQLVPVDRTYSTLAYTMVIRLPPARFLVEYDHVGNALGRGANGAPTTLKDDAMTVRGEVLF